jgi:hypothetical protein
LPAGRGPAEFSPVNSIHHTFMKQSTLRFLFAASLLVLAFSLAAFLAPTIALAQLFGGGGTIPISQIPRSLADGASTNCNVPISMGANRHAVIQLSGQTTNSTTTMTMVVALSNDGSAYETTAGRTYVFLAGNGSTASTNIDVDVGAAGWMKIKSLAIANGFTTNIAVNVALKPGY